MAATGKYIHNARHLLNVGATSNYVPGGQRHQINFWESADSIKTSASPVRARISALYVQVDTIAAGATGLTVRITQDAAGDIIIVPDTTALFSAGITTATKGGAVYKIDVDYKHTDSVAWLHFKTNVPGSTCNVRIIDFVWEE